MSIDLHAELNEFKAMVVTLMDDILRERGAVDVSTINTENNPKLIFRVSEEGKRGKLVNGVAVNSLVFNEASIL